MDIKYNRNAAIGVSSALACFREKIGDTSKIIGSIASDSSQWDDQQHNNTVRSLDTARKQAVSVMEEIGHYRERLDKLIDMLRF